MIDRCAKRQKTASLKVERPVSIGRIILVLCLLSIVLCPANAKAKANADSVYNGTTLKLDIASPLIVSAANKWKIQHYEMAVNVRLAKRFYPTLELGYSGGTKTQGDTVNYRGQGGFFRVGLDINPLKKHPESPHALLVGVRLGTSVQDMTQSEVSGTRKILTTGAYADCWGEIVLGCQVEIAKVNSTSFYMGWMGRFKCLFTRTQAKQVQPNIEHDDTSVTYLTPIFIPGFGARDDIGWGASYHLGWRF